MQKRSMKHAAEITQELFNYWMNVLQQMQNLLTPI